MKTILRLNFQAKSYSLLLGINNFVVASPEGFWIYKLSKNKEALIESINSDEFKEREEQIRNMLLTLTLIVGE